MKVANTKQQGRERNHGKDEPLPELFVRRQAPEAPYEHDARELKPPSHTGIHDPPLEGEALETTIKMAEEGRLKPTSAHTAKKEPSFDEEIWKGPKHDEPDLVEDTKPPPQSQYSKSKMDKKKPMMIAPIHHRTCDEEELTPRTSSTPNPPSTMLLRPPPPVIAPPQEQAAVDEEMGVAPPTNARKPTGVIAVAERVSSMEEDSSQLQLPSSGMLKEWRKDRRTRTVLAVAILLFIALLVCIILLATKDNNEQSGTEIPTPATVLPGTWVQLGDTVLGAQTVELFGGRLSLSKDGTAFIAGAEDYTGENGFLSGAARVHAFLNETWVQVGQQLEGTAVKDSFGISVSINGNGTIIAIGGYFYDPPDVECCNAGFAQVYRLIGGEWVQMGSDLLGEAKADRFGLEVTLSEDGMVLAVGARQSDRAGKDTGTVRVFRFVSGNWTQIGQHIDGEAKGDRFGEAAQLSADGTVLAIGARRNDGNGEDSGHVRVYQFVSGQWTQIGQDIDGEADGDEASGGPSLSLSGDARVVAIGASKHDSIYGNNTGHVRTFHLSPEGNWTLLGTELHGDNPVENFGKKVSLNHDGTVLAVGDPLSAAAFTDSGQVRIYHLVDNQWIQVGQSINGEARDDGFGGGLSLSADGNIVAIGADRYNGNGKDSGQVRVFKLDT